MATVIGQVFTFIRNALLFSAQLGTSYAGTIAASVIAGVVTAGLAVGTARAFGSMLKPDIPGIGQNSGTRIQLAPDTGNRIQVVYGDVFTSGPVCDANISNENQTMHYFIVLSEKTDSGTFAIGSQGIFFGDKKCTFGSGASAHICVSSFDRNGTAGNNLANLLRVRVYAGGTAASNQIFPVPGGSVTAVDATTMMPHWDNTTNYKGTDLVFAMVELDYDAEQSVYNLEPLTFHLTNSLKNPGDVAADYMTNSVYGAGIANSSIDLTSLTGSSNANVAGYCDELVTYQLSTGANANIARYQINGTLNTFDDAQTNIDKIAMAGGFYLSFDGKQGKYRGIPNKQDDDLANAFVLNDDNILGSMQLQNTDLYQMYNSVEVEFYDDTRKDQRNTVFVETPSGDRNTGEPDNTLNYSIDMINKKVHAEMLANIDLKQSRKDKIVQFSGDHSTLQIDVGDVVKVDNTMLGFTEKPFRVMRIIEKENEETALTTEITALEYDATLYVPALANTAVQDDPPPANSNIGGPVDDGIRPPRQDLRSPYIIEAEQTSTTGSGTGAKFTIIKDIYPTSATYGDYTTAIVTTSGSGYATSDVLTFDGAYLGGLTPTHDCTVDLANATIVGGALTQFQGIFGADVTGNCMLPPKKGEFITEELIGNTSLGIQIEDKPADKTDLGNTMTYTELFTTRELDFTAGTGIEPGDYSFMSAGTPIGSLSGTANVSFFANVNIEYGNGNVQNELFGITETGFTSIPAITEANKKITIAENPVAGNVTLLGINTMDQTPGGDRGYAGIRYDMLRLNKGDTF